MITTSPSDCSCCFVAQVVLSDGSIAGEGAGPTVESAKFWAVYGAIRSENPRFVTAGRGHLVYLTARDVESLAKWT